MKAFFKSCLKKIGVRMFFEGTMPLGFDPILDIRNHFENYEFKLIIDAGANVGQSVVYFKKQIPSVEVISFEPVSSTFAELRKNTSGFDKVHLEQKALGDIEGIEKIEIKTNNLWNTLKTKSIHGVFESVEVITLDKYFEKKGLGHISLLKVDVEGFEENLFEGSKGILRHGHVDFILVEVGINHDDNSHSYLENVKHQLEGFGFHFIHYYTPALVGKSGHFANALFYDSKRLKYV
ncbi:MAG: FkbM family methyltransferase [Cryomorphaceae bacterium]|jgi:FkbM family methyltransferase